ncbi:hypothetical protein ACLKA6_012125 [Drosophila palustris]
MVALPGFLTNLNLRVIFCFLPVDPSDEVVVVSVSTVGTVVSSPTTVVSSAAHSGSSGQRRQGPWDPPHRALGLGCMPLEHRRLHPVQLNLRHQRQQDHKEYEKE